MKKAASKNTDEKTAYEVTLQTNIGELINLYPETANIMLEYGLACVGCFASSFDTIEQGALIHGMTEEEIEEMIFRINEYIKREQKMTNTKSDGN